MRRWLILLCCLGGFLFAQQSPPDTQAPSPGSSQASQQKSRERSAEAGESSSRDTRIDTAPPKDDAKQHPGGATFPDDRSVNPDDVSELRSFNPYRAVKDDEVADYYFKQKNYKAALARYQDALANKENDATANFGMAECYEKLGQPDQAILHYKEYLKILPNGPLSKHAKKALEKLGEKQTAANTK